MTHTGTIIFCKGCGREYKLPVVSVDFLNDARAAAAQADDLLRRLDEWDVMQSTADGPYWRGEIARVRQALAADHA